ncbi:Homocysteine S-methyltransferase [Cordyceps fumosorosea ARSEF 2679]|uniref:Homocysteine S-methyltransferase n=1 Tax=Cordyceps fumosorosea (strain ARSEF 2679) TaxID=1081104 RepID=A0A167MZD9_CORFA|nr:Homocysteine S-methyltransferase [Cordyceps fumosorosea ARSEF 2679]OAA54942.1 Homocysteine S-methyltransferase [Cordyceps fumosorosea ARSEF 2679]
MESPILILDGGLGTSLEQKYGCTFDHTTPLWSSDLLVSEPARLRQCQADFGRVPVDILQTATYQVSVAGFAKTRDPEAAADQQQGIPRERIPHYVDAAVRIAREAAPAPTTRLALSVGPYGACMLPSSQEYTGAYDADLSSEAALFAWHRDRLQLLAAAAAAGPDISFVALETVPRVDELRAMRRALAATPALAAIPSWTSCLFPAGTDEDPRMPDGSDAAAALRAMLDPSVAAPSGGVGINCTRVGRRLDVLLERYEEAVAGLLREGVAERWPALVLYPDGTNGEVYDTVTRTWVMAEEMGEGRGVSWAQQLAETVRRTRARGRWAQIVVGGCCRAGAEDIAALRAELL